MEGGHSKVKAREIKKALEKEHQSRTKAYDEAVREQHHTLVRLKAHIEEIEFLQEMFFGNEKDDIPF